MAVSTARLVVEHYAPPRRTQREKLAMDPRRTRLRLVA
jgi:hypothetical protein